MDAVDEAEEHTGHWWLPESPHNRLTGTLRIGADGRSELTVHDRLRVDSLGTDTVTDGGGSVRTVTSEDLHRDGVYERILGEVDGEPFTLDDCFMLQRRGGFFASNISYERILTQQVYRGVLLREPQAEFNSVTVDMAGLAQWVGLTGLAGDWHQTAAKGSRIDVTAVQLPPLTATDGAGNRFTIRQQPNIVGDGITMLGAKQEFTLTFASRSRRPLPDLLDLVGDVQNLVSIAMDLAPALRAVRLTRSDHQQTIGGRRFDVPVELFTRWQIKPPIPSESGRIRPTFTMNDLGGTAGLRRWLQVSTVHRSHISRAVSSFAAPHLWVSDRLLNATAALEGFDRVSHRRADLHVRLDRLGNEAGERFDRLVGDVAIWSRSVARERHNIAHHNPGVLMSGERQLYLAQSAYYLLVLCALRAAKAPEGVLDSVAESQSFLWLAERLRSS